MIYHFNLAYLQGMSGGDRCALELIRYFAAQGLDNTLITTRACRDTFLGLGLEENERCRFILIPDYAPSEVGLSILSAYIRRTMVANRILKAIEPGDGDVLFCHNEFFPNIIPFNRIAKRSPNAKLVYHLHMVAPDLFRGYQGQFTGEFHWPSLRLISYRLQQLLFRKTVPERALVLYNNSYYDRIIARWFPRNRKYNIERYSGVEIPEMPEQDKVYDMVWCGRFHAQKGVMEIVDIMQRVKKRKPDVRLAVIGSGEPWETRLRRAIEKNRLGHSIDLKGHLEGEEKFSVLKSARVFLMTSLFESFGQANLEAMKCGLPVVAYNLPVYHVFERGMIKVELYDRQSMASEIYTLLSDENLYEQASRAALAFSRQFSWGNTGHEVLQAISDG